MLPKQIIHHMEVDELRNYAVHLSEILDAHGQLSHAQGEIILAMQGLVNARNYKEESLNRLNARRDCYREFEKEMEQKYGEYMPRPVCDTDCAIGLEDD